MTDSLASHSVQPLNAWFPADDVLQFRREGRGWRFEFPYKPSSSIPFSEPRYVIPLPDNGISADGQTWFPDQSHRV